MITYNPLWETMREKGISQYRLIHCYGVSAGQINRLKNNVHVSTHTLEMLCDILDCGIDGVVAYVSDKKPDKKSAAEKLAAAPEE